MLEFNTNLFEDGYHSYKNDLNKTTSNKEVFWDHERCFWDLLNGPILQDWIRRQNSFLEF